MIVKNPNKWELLFDQFQDIDSLKPTIFVECIALFHALNGLLILKK